MRLKTLRTAVAAFALVAAIPITMTPAEARVMLSECERWAWSDCESMYGSGYIGDPEFAACYEAKRIEYCGPPGPPRGPGGPTYPLWPCDLQQGCPAEPPVSPNP